MESLCLAPISYKINFEPQECPSLRNSQYCLGGREGYDKICVAGYRVSGYLSVITTVTLSPIVQWASFVVLMRPLVTDHTHTPQGYV